MFSKDKLLNEIDKKGWSRYRLSKESGVAQTTLRDIFGQKQVTPSTKTLEKISQALEVPISSFFDENINSTNETNISASNNLKTTKSPSKYELLEDKYKKLIDNHISELLKLQQDENNSK